MTTQKEITPKSQEGNTVSTPGIAGIITIDRDGRDAERVVLSLYDPMGYSGSEEINDEPLDVASASLDTYIEEDIDSLLNLPAAGRYLVLDHVRAVSYARVVAASECGTDDEDHDWQAPHSLVGGITNNPGVWGLGGTTLRYMTVCSKCGTYRIETTYGLQRNGGQEDSVEYRAADKRSLAWVLAETQGE
jgi:hypothetical protein